MNHAGTDGSSSSRAINRSAESRSSIAIASTSDQSDSGRSTTSARARRAARKSRPCKPVDIHHVTSSSPLPDHPSIRSARTSARSPSTAIRPAPTRRRTSRREKPCRHESYSPDVESDGARRTRPCERVSIESMMSSHRPATATLTSAPSRQRTRRARPCRARTRDADAPSTSPMSRMRPRDQHRTAQHACEPNRHRTLRRPPRHQMRTTRPNAARSRASQLEQIAVLARSDRQRETVV